MKNLINKTPARRELLIQAYAREGEWDAKPFGKVPIQTPKDGVCLAKFYGCHFDEEAEECNPGDVKMHLDC